uniref:Uncharacterized protein n=1 Tax=viral metagenome TaxID=1070528 RepID=A0A6M3KGG8_9ZZZZ
MNNWYSEPITCPHCGKEIKIAVYADDDSEVEVVPPNNVKESYGPLINHKGSNCPYRPILCQEGFCEDCFISQNRK